MQDVPLTNYVADFRVPSDIQSGGNGDVGFSYDLVIQAGLGWEASAFSIWRDWTPYAVWDIPAGLTAEVSNKATIYLGWYELSFELIITGLEFVLEALYSTNMHNPGH